MKFNLLIMKKLLLIFFTILSFNFSYSQDFYINGISYSVIPTTKTVKVNSNQLYTISSLIIPSSVTYLSINYSVSKIDNYAFYDGINFYTSVSIPNSVTSIGDGAFYNFNAITTLIIPDSVASIGAEAFYGCSSLITLSIPNSVASIGAKAFYDCSSLTTLSIPNSVTSIGAGAFYNCSLLSSLIIPNSITTITNGCFSNCNSLTTLIIPNSVTSIESYAFLNGSSLTTLIIPNSVTSIGGQAFQACTALKSLSLGNSINLIENYAFTDCTSLTSITCYRSTPFVINHTVFNNVNYSNCCLIIPTNSLSVYQSSLIWKDFLFTCGNLNIDSYNKTNQLTLFPNPAKQNLNVKLDYFSPLQEITITDIQGKTINNQKLKGLTTTINTSNFEKGIYILNLVNGTQKINKKFIIE